MQRRSSWKTCSRREQVCYWAISQGCPRSYVELCAAAPQRRLLRPAGNWQLARSTNARRRHHQPCLLVVENADSVGAEVHGHHGALSGGQEWWGWVGEGFGWGLTVGHLSISERPADETSRVARSAPTCPAPIQPCRLETGHRDGCAAGCNGLQGLRPARRCQGERSTHLGDQEDAYSRR